MFCPECTVLELSGDTIKDSPLGQELTLEECDKLASIGLASGLEHGMFLLEEGLQDDALHVITKGTLEVVKKTGGGDWVALKVIRPGDMVGELCFVDGIAHSASVRAITDSEVFSLHRAEFEKLLSDDPQLTYKVMRSIIRTVHGIISNMNYQYVEMTNYITKQHGRY